jgi:hypothetical protein
MIITSGANEPLTLSLKQLDNDPCQARYILDSPMFQQTALASAHDAELCQRVLDGLARQLRTPLDHDAAQGQYSIVIPVLE